MYLDIWKYVNRMIEYLDWIMYLDIWKYVNRMIEYLDYSSRYVKSSWSYKYIIDGLEVDD